MADKPRVVRDATLTPEQREADRKARERELKRKERDEWCPEPGARLTPMDRIRMAPKRRPLRSPTD